MKGGEKGMSIGELLSCGGAGAFVLMCLVQIAPIKINPWSWIAQKLGRAINGEVIKKVEGIEDDVRRIERKQDEQQAVMARVRILRFNDELLRDIPHSKEHFDQTMVDIKVYESFCRENPDFENNVTVYAIQNIKDCYMERLKKHDFL